MHDFKIGDLVIYKNNQLIAFNKPPGLAVQPDPSGQKSLQELAEIYTQSKVEIVHRIDQPTSGVVLFAKTTKAVQQINEQFQNRQIQKYYLAVVAERPEADQGTLRHFLKKQTHGNKTIASETEIDGGKEGVLNYQYLASSDRYHLLQIELITGRHHQIRAQLGAVGNPVKGDVKYGFRRSNKDRSIHLHAWKLSFLHPVSQEREWLQAPLPSDPVWDALPHP